MGEQRRTENNKKYGNKRKKVAHTCGSREGKGNRETVKEFRNRKFRKKKKTK